MTTTVTPEQIAKALIDTAGNKGRAAELLGMSSRTFGRRLAEHAEKIEALIAAAQADEDEITATIEAADASQDTPAGTDETPVIEVTPAMIADGPAPDGEVNVYDDEATADDIATARAEARTAGELADIRSETDPDADATGDTADGTESTEGATPAEPAAPKPAKVPAPKQTQNKGPAQAVKDAPAFFPAGVITPVQFRHHLVRQQLAPESLSTQKVYGWLDSKTFPVRFYAEDGTVYDTKTTGAIPGITISEGVAWYNTKFGAKA